MKPESSESRVTEIRAALRDLHRDQQVDLPALSKLLDCSEDEAVEKASEVLEQALATIDGWARSPCSPDCSPDQFLKSISSPREIPEGREMVSAFVKQLVAAVYRLGHRLAAKGYLTKEQRNQIPWWPIE